MNAYTRVLLFGGPAAIAIGVITAVASNAEAQRLDYISRLTGTLVGGVYDPNAGVTAQGWMWFGIGLAILGVLMLVLAIAVLALRSRPATVEVRAAD